MQAVAYVSLCIIWGSTFLGLKVAAATIPPWMMIAGRSLLAGLLLTGFALARGRTLPARGRILSAFVSGLLLFASGQALLAWGEQRVPSGEAAVLNATLALFMPLVGWACGTGRRPSALTAAGLGLGFLGVAVLMRFGAGGGTDPLGSVAILATCLSWSFGTAVARRWPVSNSIAMGAGLQMIGGGLGCLLLSLVVGEWHGFTLAQISTPSLVAFSYLVIFGSLLAFSAFAWLAQIWPTDRLATYTYINPIVALLLGAGLAHEELTLRHALATVLILGAVALAMGGGRLQRLRGPEQRTA